MILLEPSARKPARSVLRGERGGNSSDLPDKLNNAEKATMNKHIGFARFCYNYALSLYKQIDHKRYKGGSSKKIDLIRKIFTNVTKKNPDFAWTKTMSSRVYQNAFRALKAAFFSKVE